MYRFADSLLKRSRRAFLVWTCLALFTGVCVAENTHLHPKSGRSEQNCLLCIAAHSVARPAQIVTVAAAPARCVAVLTIGAQSAGNCESILSLYIRPPPAV